MHSFSHEQLNQINSRGISLQEVNRQIDIYHRGISPVILHRPASPGEGIEVFSEKEIEIYSDIWNKGFENSSVLKFVPASGAASRMFKKLFEAQLEYQKLNENQDYIINRMPEISDFFAKLIEYPFHRDLEEICTRKDLKINTLLSEKKYADVLALILNQDGLNYGFLPKGLLKFHKYGVRARTPLEEHLIEASGYLKDSRDQVFLHFTVSPEHRIHFESLSGQLIKWYKENFNLNFEISFSEQDPSTDTIAVSMDNKPFVSHDGKLLFRPGGHGALLKNLQNISQSIVFIGNIDNVAPDRIKDLRIRYKKLLGGILIQRVQKIHSFMDRLDSDFSARLRTEIVDYTREFISPEKADRLNSSDGNDFKMLTINIYNRPVRICGMVKNTGEPGGGPFWIKNSIGDISKQIIESSQVEMNNDQQKALFNSSSHFNPVDLACYTRDYKGNKFNLNSFIDHEMTFVAIKSQEGKDVKTLELPGLWNGGMAGWITFFVEVPAETFSPVKTVFDLLRPEHQ